MKNALILTGILIVLFLSTCMSWKFCFKGQAWAEYYDE